MKKIEIGEPQPVDCVNCKAKEGYQYSDYMSLHYTTFHDSEGKHEGGQYSEGCKQLNNATTPYCLNCGERLKFKLIRKSHEELEAKKYGKYSRFV